MNILIIGCGKLGARLANVLDSQDHNISVIANEKSLTESENIQKSAFHTELNTQLS